MRRKLSGIISVAFDATGRLLIIYSAFANNIRTDLQEVEYGYMDWIGLAHDRDRWRTLVSAVMNLRVA